MAEKTVTLTLEVLNRTQTLHPHPDSVEIGDGDEVVWKFPAMPSEQFGFVFFEPRLGPFHSLRSRSNQEILANGNIGSASGSNQFVYTAMILQPGVADPIATGTGTVVNQATKVNTAPECYVIYHPDAPPDEALEVSPNPLNLYPGDTATWYFIDLPEGAFTNFQFIGEPNPATGPFEAFYACGGSGPVTVRASGTGFAGKEGQYTYHLEVRNQDGEIIGSHDPLIDTLGVPPTP